MVSLTEYFTDCYKNGDLKVYKKAQIFAPVVGLILVFSVLLGLAMFFTQAFAVAGAIGALVTSCVGVLVLLRKGAYSLSVGVFLYTLFVVMFFAIKFDQYQTLYETYVFASLGLFLLVVSGLVSVSKRQIDSITLMILLGIGVLYFLDAFPLDNYRLTLLAIQSLVTSMILVIVGGFFVRRTVGMQTILLEEGVRLSQHIQQTYEKTAEALSETQRDIEGISSRLSQTSQRLSVTSKEVETFLQEIYTHMEDLSAILISNTRHGEEVLRTQKEVGESMHRHLERFEEGISVVSRTIDLIQKSGDTAHERQEALHQMFSLVNETDKSLKELSSQVDSMKEMLQKLVEINVLISDIAEKTHMLGLNASIEASHFGAEGKGFRIVAEEIRHLAQNARQRSGEVSSFLQRIEDIMELIGHFMKKTVDFFETFHRELDDTHKGLQDTFENLQLIAKSNERISQFLGDFSIFGKQLKDSMDMMGNALEGSLEQTEKAENVSQQLSQHATHLKQHFVLLVEEASVLAQLSSENQQEILRLKEKIG